MPRNLYSYCRPVNGQYLDVRCEPINQARVSGGGVSTTYEGDRAYVSGAPIRTDNVVIGYTVTIKYTGPVEIHERILLQQQVANFETDPTVISETIQATGIRPYTDNCFEAAYSNSYCCFAIALSCCCCGGCFCLPCIISERNTEIGINKVTYHNKLFEIADDRMSRAIAPLVAQADSDLSGRLKHIYDQMQRQQQAQQQQQQQQTQQQQQFQQLLVALAAPGARSAGGSGSVHVDPVKYQQFLQFQQAQGQGVVQGSGQPQGPAQMQTAQTAQTGAASAGYVPPPVMPSPVVPMSVTAPGTTPTAGAKPEGAMASRI